MLYSEKVKQLVAEMPGCGDLPDATHSARAENPVCGDVTQLLLKVDRGVVIECRFQAVGCAAAIAAAAAIAELCRGRTSQECRAISVDDVVEFLEGLPRHKRHGAELAIETVRRALEGQAKR